MASIIDDLKAQARILQRQATAGDAAALARLRADGVTNEPIKRSDCLGALARELGFAGWPPAATALGGEPTDDFGNFLYPREASAHTNIWFASYEEARDVHAERDDYLLAYRHQFFVADRDFITTLGVDPDDTDWQNIGRDWVRPGSLEARARLAAKLVRARQSGMTMGC